MLLNAFNHDSTSFVSQIVHHMHCQSKTTVIDFSIYSSLNTPVIVGYSIVRVQSYGRYSSNQKRIDLIHSIFELLIFASFFYHCTCSSPSRPKME